MLQKMGLVAMEGGVRVIWLHRITQRLESMREKKLKTMEWTAQAERYKLVQSPEQHVWWTKWLGGEVRDWYDV